MTERPPIAFMSYVHADDKYRDLSTFRERLGDEVGAQLGADFQIFQDRFNIGWGQQWRERIEESLDAVTFLIPIITPRFFGSKPCRDELSRFLERERTLRRNDLVLPVYYIDHPPLNDSAKNATDELLQVIASHQYADWRDLRFEPLTSQQARKRLEQMALQLRSAIERTQKLLGADGTDMLTASYHDDTSPVPSEPKDLTSKSTSGGGSEHPAPKTASPLRIVDPLHRGDHPSISAAIKAAQPGDQIVVRPGFYQEGLVIDKPLEILGEGSHGEVVVQAKGRDTILFKTTMGRVANLILRQVGDGDWYGVNITQGRLELEDCDINGQGVACVGIRGGADPRLRRNRVHDGEHSGVFVHEAAQGVLEDNDIFGNTYAGVEIESGGSPTLRRNRINRNGHAVAVHEGGSGTVEDNDLRDNKRGAWDVSSDSEPKLTRVRNLE